MAFMFTDEEVLVFNEDSFLENFVGFELPAWVPKFIYQIKSHGFNEVKSTFFDWIRTKQGFQWERFQEIEVE
jgi:hypothetical protein